MSLSTTGRLDRNPHDAQAFKATKVFGSSEASFSSSVQLCFVCITLIQDFVICCKLVASFALPCLSIDLFAHTLALNSQMSLKIYQLGLTLHWHAQGLRLAHRLCPSPRLPCELQAERASERPRVRDMRTRCLPGHARARYQPFVVRFRIVSRSISSMSQTTREDLERGNNAGVCYSFFFTCPL